MSSGACLLVWCIGAAALMLASKPVFLLRRTGEADLVIFLSALIIGGGILVSASGLFTALLIFLFFLVVLPLVIARLMALGGLTVTRAFSRKRKTIHSWHDLHDDDFVLGDDGELVEIEQWAASQKRR
jgi:hypothetical protein